jgi:hypothetical protein
MIPGFYEDPGEELCFIIVDYRKKQWGKLEEATGTFNIKTVTSAMKEIPDFYNLLLHRHMRLKNIYLQCRKRDYIPVS